METVNKIKRLILSLMVIGFCIFTYFICLPIVDGVSFLILVWLAGPSVIICAVISFGLLFYSFIPFNIFYLLIGIAGLGYSIYQAIEIIKVI